MSDYCTQNLLSQGVNILLNTDFVSFSYIQSDQNGNRIRIKIKKNDDSPEVKNPNTIHELLCDHLIIASGASPATDLALTSGLQVDKVRIFYFYYN